MTSMTQIPGVLGKSDLHASSHSLALEELENSRYPSDTLVVVDVNAVGRESQAEPGLEQLLQDRDGFMLFAKHLQSEFASEVGLRFPNPVAYFSPALSRLGFICDLQLIRLPQLPHARLLTSSVLVCDSA